MKQDIIVTPNHSIKSCNKPCEISISSYVSTTGDMTNLIFFFLNKVRFNEKPTWCWDWIGNRNNQGYGRFRYRKRRCLAHRLSYTLFISEIPDGLTIDHLCRNRKCVNPDHLEAVTKKENTLRGIGLPAQNARKTHCIRDHTLSGDNLFITNRNERQCRTCHNARGELNRNKKKGEKQIVF